MNIYIFGAGHWGKRLQKFMGQGQDYSVIGFLDNAAKERAGVEESGIPVPVFTPEEGVQKDYEKIVISNSTPSDIAEIKAQLLALGVPKEKIQALYEDEALLTDVIVNTNLYDEEQDPRVLWLRNFAYYAEEHNMQGAVAECGVYRGEFAYYINKYFPEKILYLFDTFEGFSEDDIRAERAQRDEHFLNGAFNKPGFFSDTNENFVMGRMLHPENCVVKKGLFPDTARGGMVNREFCFVNLDMDLYQPMLEGIRFFLDRMCPGGVILLHDYFNSALPGVRQAVSDFEKEYGSVCKTVIGDFNSIAIIKES